MSLEGLIENCDASGMLKKMDLQSSVHRRSDETGRLDWRKVLAIRLFST